MAESDVHKITTRGQEMKRILLGIGLAISILFLLWLASPGLSAETDTEYYQGYGGYHE